MSPCFLTFSVLLLLDKLPVVWLSIVKDFRVCQDIEVLPDRGVEICS
jgi:hypothetical protein